MGFGAKLLRFYGYLGCLTTIYRFGFRKFVRFLVKIRVLEWKKGSILELRFLGAKLAVSLR